MNNKNEMLDILVDTIDAIEDIDVLNKLMNNINKVRLDIAANAERQKVDIIKEKLIPGWYWNCG